MRIRAALFDLGLELDWLVLRLALDWWLGPPLVSTSEVQVFAAEMLVANPEDDEILALASFGERQEDETRAALDVLARRSSLTVTDANDVLLLTQLRDELASPPDEPVTSQVSRLLGFFADPDWPQDQPPLVLRWRLGDTAPSDTWSVEGYASLRSEVEDWVKNRASLLASKTGLGGPSLRSG